MKSLKFSGKLKKHSPIIIRRVAGQSMSPSLPGGKIIVARTLFCSMKPSDVVIVFHGGLEKIKRVSKIDGKNIYILGDNPSSSTDSRDFGWISSDKVKAKLLWPNSNRKFML